MVGRRMCGRRVRLWRAGTIAAALLAVAGGGAVQASGQAVSAAAQLSDHTAIAGTISTVAGGVGGPAKATKVSLFADSNSLCDVSFGAGTVYVGDGDAVRAINPLTDWLVTPAGTGVGGPLGDGGPAARASMDGACGVAVDPHRNLVIAESFDQQVRVVAAATGTFYGQAMTAGDIYTIGGTGTGSFSGDGGPATAAVLYGPAGVVADSAGNLVITDSDNNRVRVLAARTGTFYRRAVTAGHIYTIAGTGVTGFSGDGGAARQAELYQPAGITTDHAGNLVIADTGNNRVRVVAAATGTFYGRAMTSGHIYAVAGGGTAGLGDGGAATEAELSTPRAVAIDAAGNLVIADSDHNRVRVVADRTGTFYGRAMTAGDIYTVAGDGTYGYSGDGGRATKAELGTVLGLTVDSAGNVAISDDSGTFNQRVRVVAAATGSFYGQPMTAGDIYTVVGGYPGFSGDGGPATVAGVYNPAGLATDDAGNLLIADAGNDRIRMVTR